MTDEIRVRFAPSPTGGLHIGGARTALFNWAFARRHGGSFVLRIEDTDRERSTAEHERSILEGLRWMGLDWDEGPDVGGDHGPYRQTERGDRHASYVERLFASGHAYHAFDSPERIQAMREAWMSEGTKPVYDGADLTPEEARARVEAGEPAVVRFRVPEGQTRFTDAIRGEVVVENGEVDDWVMARSDGHPTYNLVVVCDDVDMAITHILRGDDHLTNTTKQVLVYRALGLEPPAFAHFPLMLGKDKKKLSKRTGDTALQDYRDKGYPPEAVLNFLCLQGWALDGETEVFPAAKLIECFDPGDVSKAGAVFDPDKFLWMAGEYVRADDAARVAERAEPFVVAAGLDATDERYAAAVALVQERVRLYSEVPEKIAFLYAADEAVAFQEKAEKNARKQVVGALADYLAWLEPRLEAGTDAETLREDTKAWIGEQGLKMPALFQPLRCALTGEPGGPDLFEIMALLGTGPTLRRIRFGLERLAG